MSQNDRPLKLVVAAGLLALWPVGWVIDKLIGE